MPDLTTRTEPPGAVVIQPGTIAPGRARGVAAAPARGPGQADRARRSTPTTSSSRAPGTGPRSARPTRTPGSSRSTSTPPSTGRRSSSSPPPTSPATTSSARSRRTSRSSSRSAARSSTTPSRSPSSPRPIAATLRAARRRRPRPDRAAPGGLRPARRPTTCSPPTSIGAGDLDAAFAAADLVLEGEYRVGHQEQLYIENNAMIAVPRDDGGVTVHGSLQCPYYVHAALKRGLGDRRRAGAGRPGRDRRRVRRQGGVPVDDRPPRRAPGAARPAARSG